MSQPIPSATELAPPPAFAQAAPSPRTRWAILTLYVLAPMVAELLTSSTPPLAFFTPLGILYQTAFYGSGALLIRDAARRRGIGWGGIFLMGMAYGILEEGLVNTTWFNPYWPDVLSLKGYGRFWDLNWVWALNLTLFHATVSITTSILLAEIMFPRVARQPWLGRKAPWGFGALLFLASALGLWLFGFVLFAPQGFTHPPASYSVAVAAFALCLCLGLRKPRPPAPIAAPAPEAVAAQARLPRLWTLRALGFLGIFSYFFVPAALQAFRVPFPITVAGDGALALLAIWRIRAWARRAGWNTRHMLALASGALGLFILVFDPVLEIMGHSGAKVTRGAGVVALVGLITLIVLARRAKMQNAIEQTESA